MPNHRPKVASTINLLAPAWYFNTFYNNMAYMLKYMKILVKSFFNRLGRFPDKVLKWSNSKSLTMINGANS